MKTDQAVMPLGRLDPKTKRIPLRMRYLNALGLPAEFPAVDPEANKTLTKLSVYAGSAPGGATRREIFDDPQNEFWWVDEDRQFGICGKGCPIHGTTPILQRQNFDGVNYYRARCVFVECPYTGQWHRTREKAKRLWNMQVLLSKP